MCSANHCVVTAYVHIFIYSKHKTSFFRVHFLLVYTYILHKHPDLSTALFQVCQENSCGTSSQLTVIEFSWFTVNVGCIHLKSSAGRSTMSSWWAEAGHKSIIYPLCSIQKILSAHSMSWRQLIHCTFTTDYLLYTHIISRLLHFQTTDKICFFSIKEEKAVCLLLVSSFFLVGAEPAENFV